MAEKRFTEAMELDTTCSEARYHLGCLYFQRHETEHAEHQWLKAIEHNPLEKGAYNALASLYFKQGQAKKALRYWKQFIYLRPTDALAHYNVGLVYQKLGMMRDSNQYMKQFMALKPHCPEAKELRAHYQQSIEVAHHNLKQAELHLQQGRLKRRARRMRRRLAWCHCTTKCTCITATCCTKCRPGTKRWRCTARACARRRTTPTC
ncbi:MAG: tetratricopeptide repeat protein [Vampirovibrionales bacterium]